MPLTRARARVCMCVRVCLCACVYVFITFHHKGVFRLQWYLGDTSIYGPTILCFEYYSRCFYQVPSSPFLNMWESNMIYASTKRWYAKPTNDEKKLKIRRLLQSKFFHFELVLGIRIKKLRLFCSKVVASLRLALFVDALDEIS